MTGSSAGQRDHCESGGIDDGIEQSSAPTAETVWTPRLGVAAQVEGEGWPGGGGDIGGGQQPRQNREE
jgi:hypothetical protein